MEAWNENGLKDRKRKRRASKHGRVQKGEGGRFNNVDDSPTWITLKNILLSQTREYPLYSPFTERPQTGKTKLCCSRIHTLVVKLPSEAKILSY